ncbi:TcpE family conjugal transfer membrane protein [Enterococcus faecalis]|uniref:TcpE family conjugal transfer membrane protein n=1 Tax=Enterococcus faecalis TaxID=1351 RepID=UPI00189BE512|nr:TcpE family conjugal transfer membrane protein [Enterococcus faecalis]
MKRNKQIFDYREPFNAPYMIREIAKNVRLPFVVYAQDFTIAMISFGCIFGFLIGLFGFNQLTLLMSIGVSYGMIQLFNKVEPDGKRVDIFVKDYLNYLIHYGLSKKVVYHEHLEKIRIEKSVYKKVIIRL